MLRFRFSAFPVILLLLSPGFSWAEDQLHPVFDLKVKLSINVTTVSGPLAGFGITEVLLEQELAMDLARCGSAGGNAYCLGTFEAAPKFAGQVFRVAIEGWKRAIREGESRQLLRITLGDSAQATYSTVEFSGASIADRFTISGFPQRGFDTDGDRVEYVPELEIGPK